MKTIKFFPKSTEAEMLVPKPQPSKNYTPMWYKKLSMHYGEEFVYVDKDLRGPNITSKMCVPFSDSFNMGYIQETWCDIFFENMKDGTINYSYSMPPSIISHRENKNTDGVWSKEYNKTEFLWQMQWIPQLPKGYSVIYTHPFNMPDLPFLSLTGVVDSDSYKYESEGNHPFLLKKGFSGIIPAGTPMIQIIPFKRDKWSSTFLNHNPKDQINSLLSRKKFVGGYKKMFWERKYFK